MKTKNKIRAKFILLTLSQIIALAFFVYLTQEYHILSHHYLIILISVFCILILLSVIGETIFINKEPSNVSIFWDKYGLDDILKIKGEEATTRELKKLTLNRDIPELDRNIAGALLDLYSKANKFI